MPAHEHISQEQVGELAGTLNQGGGFSVKAVGPGAGMQATDGYMVGIPGYGRDFPVGDTDPADINKYINDYHDLLAQHDIFLGGWQGSNPKRGSVDVSRRFGREMGWSGVMAAKRAAVQGNQEAIGVVGTPKSPSGYLGDIKNPNYDPTGGHEERGLSQADEDWVKQGWVTIQTGSEAQPRVTRMARRSSAEFGNTTRMPGGPVRRAGRRTNQGQ